MATSSSEGSELLEDSCRDLPTYRAANTLLEHCARATGGHQMSLKAILAS